MPARVVVLAGVNGAGKSSIGGAAILENGGEFFNPDVAARALLADNPGMSQAQANGHAWAFGRRGLERALARGEFFAFETTLGGNTIPDRLLKAGQSGAEIHLWYAGLSSPELHIDRVKRRVRAGGHDIPEHRIRERYVTSRANLIRLLPHLASCGFTTTAPSAIPSAASSRSRHCCSRCRPEASFRTARWSGFPNGPKPFWLSR